jgi:plasmid maintenance system antidote protein VapI
MFKNGMRPVHPGEVPREDYPKPLSLSANALAKALLSQLCQPICVRAMAGWS